MQTRIVHLFRALLKPLLLVASIFGVLFAGASPATATTSGIALSTIFQLT